MAQIIFSKNHYLPLSLLKAWFPIDWMKSKQWNNLLPNRTFISISKRLWYVLIFINLTYLRNILFTKHSLMSTVKFFHCRLVLGLLYRLLIRMSKRFGGQSYINGSPFNIIIFFFSFIILTHPHHNNIERWESCLPW